jgi:glyoxylase-like metal-dependent hydrolase (beta-lactamase superfamily II)
MTGPAPGSWAVEAGAAGARPVTDGVWRLRLPTSWPGIDHANAYVVEREDGIMLVDTGPGGDRSNAAALERALDATGHALADVRVLAITHAHSDHLGVARHVLDASGAELWLHPDDDHFHLAVREPERTYARREARARREGVPEARLDDFASVQEEVAGGAGDLRADHELLPGVTLPSALGDWEVVPAPGHAPSQVLLVQPEHRLAIVGDAICIAFGSWMDYGWTDDPVGEWQATLDALEGLGPIDFALPGHGRPITDVPPVIAEHRAGLDGLLDGVRRALGDGSGTAYELMERVHGHTDDGIEAIGHMTETLCVLRHLRLRGEVERDVADTHTYRLKGGPA